jgi:predicted nucleic acid-binding protein
MFVVDTNIIVPLYIRSAATEAVRKLRERDAVWRTEPFALIEFSNALASYARARYLTNELAQQCLGQAENFLRAHYFEVTDEAALELALRHKLTAYDGRFLAVAQQLGTRLITEDTKLRASAPALTQSLAEALAQA